MKTCNHSLSYNSTMTTVSTTPEFYHRRCAVCGREEVLRRYMGTTASILTKNAFRTRHEAEQQLKDILQPYSGGKPSEEFAKAYPERAADYYSNKELKQLGMEKIKSKKYEKIRAQKHR